MLITEQGFTAAIAWIKSGIEGRREFTPLQADLRELQAIEARGFGAFEKDLATYTPGRLDPYRVPKGDGKFRDVFYIPVIDRVVTLGLLLSDYDAVRQAVQRTSAGVDYHTPLPADISDAGWFLRYKDEYAAFRNRTHALQKSDHHMIFTDISNFAPSCLHPVLRFQMLAAGIKLDRTNAVHNILKTWAKNDGLTGLPQGSCMTDLLQKVYLRMIDRNIRLNHPDVAFYRYNDDLRLASTDPEALDSAFTTLRGHCLHFGLTIADHKTFRHVPGQQHNASKDSLQMHHYLQPCWDGVLLTHSDLSDRPRDVRDMDYNNLPDVFLRALGNQYLDKDIPSTLFNFIVRRMGKKGIGMQDQKILDLPAGKQDRLSITLEYIKQLHDAGRSVDSLIAPMRSVCGAEPYNQYLYVRFLDDLKALPEARAMTLHVGSSIPSDAPVFLFKAVEDAVLNASMPQASAPSSALNGVK